MTTATGRRPRPGPVGQPDPDDNRSTWRDRFRDRYSREKWDDYRSSYGVKYLLGAGVCLLVSFILDIWLLGTGHWIAALVLFFGFLAGCAVTIASVFGDRIKREHAFISSIALMVIAFLVGGFLWWGWGKSSNVVNDLSTRGAAATSAVVPTVPKTPAASATPTPTPKASAPATAAAPPATIVPAPATSSTTVAPSGSGSAGTGSSGTNRKVNPAYTDTHNPYEGGEYPAYLVPGTGNFGPAVKGNLDAVKKDFDYQIEHVDVVAAVAEDVIKNNGDVRQYADKAYRTKIDARAAYLQANPATWKDVVTFIRTNIKGYSLETFSGPYASLGMTLQKDGSRPTLLFDKSEPHAGRTLVAKLANGSYARFGLADGFGPFRLNGTSATTASASDSASKPVATSCKPTVDPKPNAAPAGFHRKQSTTTCRWITVRDTVKSTPIKVNLGCPSAANIKSGKASNATYTVCNGDTLFKIAAKRHILTADGQPDWRKLYQLNKDTVGNDETSINPGQLLRIPART